jgi:hypothetical protein
VEAIEDTVMAPAAFPSLAHEILEYPLHRPHKKPAEKLSPAPVVFATSV